MNDDTAEWPMRGHVTATIAFGDPVWAAQTLAMDRGERRRGDYDPPLPGDLIEAMHDRQKCLNALEDRMIVKGRTTVPSAEQRDAWIRPDGSLLLAGRPLARHGIRWVPANLMAEFMTLSAMPLPSSAKQRP